MSENIDSINIKSSSNFNLAYPNIDLDGDVPLCLTDDKEAASKAISLVISGTRRGFVSLCADVATLLRAKKRLEIKVDRLKREVIFLRGSPDLRSTSSCHVSQLSLSDRESLTESLQLRIINHVLKEHVDDIKLDKASISKLPQNKESKNLTGKLNKSRTDGITDSVLISKSPTINNKTAAENIGSNESDMSVVLADEEAKTLEDAAGQTRTTAEDFHLLEKKLNKALEENKNYYKEMRLMKAQIVQLQDQYNKSSDSETMKDKNRSSSKLKLKDECILYPEEIEMQSVDHIKINMNSECEFSNGSAASFFSSSLPSSSATLSTTKKKKVPTATLR